MQHSSNSLPAQVSPPDFALSSLQPSELNVVDAMAWLVRSGEGTAAGSDLALEATHLDVDVAALLRAARATGEVGEVVTVPVIRDDVDQLVFVGLGSGGVTEHRRAGAAMARSLKDRNSVAVCMPPDVSGEALQAFVIGAMLGSFEFHWRSEGPAHQPVSHIVLCGIAESRAAELTTVLRRAVAIGGASWRARALATVPSHVKNPAWLAAQAVEIAGAEGLGVEVWDETRLAEEGFGGILAVGRASATPPRFVKLEYTPVSDAPADLPHLVLVGKGITFDTGGLSIKPGDSMVSMKRDMTGAAVVLSTMAALAEVGCPVRVTGLLAIAENAVSGNALRPGDVIVHRGGRTSEVTNTDAEGRLVMADALAYAVGDLAPDVLVDVATLTGAMKVALGQHTGGFFANDEALARSVQEAGSRAGEPMWRLPLASVYEEKIASKVADADNAGGGPGAITAALFLQHFTGDLPWAHLDIASVGDAPAERHEWTTGPTGFGVRLLLEWLGSTEPLAGIG